MAQEEKAKRYDEAIERAKEWYSDTQIGIEFKANLEKLFPELKEYEDERMRKEIIEMVRRWASVHYITKEQFRERMTWLEKQGKHSIYNVPSREVILAIWDLGNEWKELTNGCISTKYGTQLNYIQKHWEESEYYLREKQGEQKPTDKVEPNFNEGDWVVNRFGDVWHIDSFDSKNYLVSNGDMYGYFPIERQNEVRPWTIADAKEGDVLACNEEILLFKSYSVQGLISLYCWYNGKINNFQSKEVDGMLLSTRNKICPATKEQRDLLFTKMKEAGYEWDADKKELRKEEVK